MFHHFIYQHRYHIRNVWTPSNLGQDFLWMVAADATNSGNNTDISGWISHEGNDYLFASTNYPLYYTSGNNSRPTIEFDVGEYVDYSKTFFNNNGFTIALLVNVNNSGTYTYMYQADKPDIEKQFAVRTIDGYINIIQNNSGIETSVLGTTQMSGWHLIIINSGGIRPNRRGIASRPISSLEKLMEYLTIEIDGVNETLRGENSYGWFGSYSEDLFKIGNDLDGEIQQLLVFPDKLSTVNQTSLRGYLNTYGGL